MKKNKLQNSEEHRGSVKNLNCKWNKTAQDNVEFNST